MTPNDFLDKHFYSPQGENTIVGKYDFFVPIVIEILRRVGMILHHFEEDLMTDSTLKYRTAQKVY